MSRPRRMENKNVSWYFGLRIAWLACRLLYRAYQPVACCRQPDFSSRLRFFFFSFSFLSCFFVLYFILLSIYQLSTPCCSSLSTDQYHSTTTSHSDPRCCRSRRGRVLVPVSPIFASDFLCFVLFPFCQYFSFFSFYSAVSSIPTFPFISHILQPSEISYPSACTSYAVLLRPLLLPALLPCSLCYLVCFCMVISVHRMSLLLSLLLSLSLKQWIKHMQSFSSASII